MNRLIYFPNLNGLRFIAAFMVIIHHIEQFKYLFMIDNSWDNKTIKILGKLGVALFFVLSGFLITYLLFFEKEKSKTINIKFFYIRRVLRIWPLYYLIVFSSIFILPYFSFFRIPGIELSFIYEFIWIKILLFICLLPNLVLSLFGALPFAAPTWSIGVEEQFYLIWPNLIKKCSKPIYAFISIAIIYYIIHYFLKKSTYHIIYNFWSNFHINLMIIGALGAHMYKNNSVILKVLFHKVFQMFTYFILFLFLIKGVKFSFLHFEIYGFLFLVIILNLAINKKSIFSLEYKWIDYLGKISYGLYLFHSLTICLVINLLMYLNIEKKPYLISFFSIIVTIVLSGLSYRYYESYFIKLKNKFAIIKNNKQ